MYLVIIVPCAVLLVLAVFFRFVACVVLRCACRVSLRFRFVCRVVIFVSCLRFVCVVSYCFACRECLLLGDTVLVVSCVVPLICLPWGGAVRVRVACVLFVLAMSCGGCVCFSFLFVVVSCIVVVPFLCLLCLVFMRCSLSFWPCRGRGAFLVLLAYDDIYRFEEC